MPWKCHWMDDTNEVHVRLRRYVDPDESCPGGYHDAMGAIIARRPTPRGDDGYTRALPVEEYQDHPSWPTVCDHPECSYAFTDADHRQVWTERIYRRAETGEEFDERFLPPGSLLDGFWLTQKGAGGIALVCVLPPEAEDTRAHWWHVDGPSRSNGVPGPGWVRVGDPRRPETLSVNPSILTDDYHGFLHGGVLTP